MLQLQLHQQNIRDRLEYCKAEEGFFFVQLAESSCATQGLPH